MKALSITLGAGVLACNSGPGPCAQAHQLVGVASPFVANKPWQGSAPSSWQNSPPSVWTSPQVQVSTPAIPRPPNPSLAGRSPSEQLQITKCRSAQSCEKCRQLNCYWDTTARITNRCIALGLESSQIPVEAGQASNLGYCPVSGQQGYVGVNWLAIENSGAAVPNLEGMSDTNVQQWLSSIPNYDPDATGANYPAGEAFKELLPTAAKAYSEGKIPSTTPWIAFFDSLSAGYNYDGYLESGYSYDVPSSDYYGGSYFGASGFGGTTTFGSSSWDSSYPAFPPSFSPYPATTSFSGSLSTIPSYSGLPLGSQLYGPQSLPSFPQQLGSSLNLGSTLPSQPIGFGAPLPMQSFETSFPVGQAIGFPAQPLGTSFSAQPIGFGQPALSPTWGGF